MVGDIFIIVPVLSELYQYQYEGYNLSNLQCSPFLCLLGMGSGRISLCNHEHLIDGFPILNSNKGTQFLVSE